MEESGSQKSGHEQRDEQEKLPRGRLSKIPPSYVERLLDLYIKIDPNDVEVMADYVGNLDAAIEDLGSQTRKETDKLLKVLNALNENFVKTVRLDVKDPEIKEYRRVIAEAITDLLHDLRGGGEFRIDQEGFFEVLIGAKTFDQRVKARELYEKYGIAAVVILEKIRELDEMITPKSRVVLIGVSDYDDKSQNLRAPKFDVKDMMETIMQVYGVPKENIVILLHHDARKENILKTIASESGTLADDQTLVLYYSGHGGLWERLDRMNLACLHLLIRLLRMPLPMFSRTR